MWFIDRSRHDSRDKSSLGGPRSAAFRITPLGGSHTLRGCRRKSAHYGSHDPGGDHHAYPTCNFWRGGDGDVSARIELEYELLLTQRLILQPRTELNFAIQDVPENGVGSGLSTAEAGLRLRYEIKREFAPYIGVSWERSVGATADFARAAAEDPSSVSFVAGLRLWF